MKFKVRLLILLPLLILTLFVFGSLFFTKAALATSFNLSGKVSDQSNNSIADTTVAVSDPNTQTTIGETTTDTNGNYSLSIPEGTYNVTATPPSSSGFQSTTIPNQNISSNTILSFVLVPISANATISGQLTDRDGNPVGHMEVGFTGPAAPGGPATITDSNGYYSVQVPTGSGYNVSINSSPGGQTGEVPTSFYITSQTTFPITQDTTINLQIPANKTIVHVEDSQNNPIAGANVFMSSSQSDSMTLATSPISISGSSTSFSADSTALTDSSGNAILWIFPIPSSQTARFVVNPPDNSSFSQVIQNISLPTGDTTQNFTLPSTFTVSGQVVDRDGNPVSGVQVGLQGSSLPGGSNGGVTDSNGHYSTQVPLGDYQLSIGVVSTPNAEVPRNFYIHYSQTTFSVNQNTTINLQIPAIKVTAHIQDSQNNPVVGADLSISGSGDSLTLSTNPMITSPGNSFSTDGLTDSSGNSTLWVFPTPSGQTSHFVVNPPSGSSLNQIIEDQSIPNNDVTLNFTLLSTVTISGQLTDRDGNPVGHMEVGFTGPAAPGGPATVTDGSGHYSVQLPTGDNYHVVIDSSPGGQTGEVPASFYIISQTTFSVNQNTTINLQIPAIKVTAHIQDPQGNPIANTSVTVSAEQSNSLILTNSPISLSGSDPSHFSTNALTDSSGNAILWFFPVPSGQTAHFLVNPPSGSSFTQFTTDVALGSDQTETFSLQFSNPTPTPTSVPTPTPTPANVAPVVSVITAPTTPVEVNTSVSVSATFTDGNPSDTHTSSWNWGDGNTSTCPSNSSSCTLTESNGSGTVTGSHAYTTAGIYSVTLTVTDNHGASGTSPTFNYIVVFDPSAGWVAGSKEFTSPSGAVVGNSGATGTATFGFQAKYQNGSMVPSGKNVSFSFPAGNINFVSTGYEWLVVNNPKAVFLADGTLNGVSGYTILISSIDQSSTHQNGLLRVQIRDGSQNVVYDTQPGAAGTADPTVSVTKGQVNVH